MKKYTSEQILAMDFMPEEDFIYIMTKDEMIWLDFITGRYFIADYIEANITEVEVVINQYELNEALHLDESDGATCLSEESAFNKICFYLYIEEYHEN